MKIKTAASLLIRGHRLRRLCENQAACSSQISGARELSESILETTTCQPDHFGGRGFDEEGNRSKKLKLLFRSSGYPVTSDRREPGCRAYPVDVYKKRLYSSASSSDGPAPVDSSTLLDEDDFHDLADEVLHHLQEKIEMLGEDLNVDGFDSDYASGVLTLRLGNLGTYVINKQTPNRQIWLSSPVSGPGRFDWVESDKKWIYRRSASELVSLLELELSQLLKTQIHLS